MWKKLANGYRAFLRETPGRRFVETHQRWKDNGHHPLVTVVIVIVAILLNVIGLLLALVPGVPGIVLGVLGFALIATRFRRVAVWLDWSEVHIRQVWHKLRQRFGFEQKVAKTAKEC